MDAKKAAQVMKPIYFKDTKAFRFTNLFFVGTLAVTVICGFISHHFMDKGVHKNTFLRRIIQEHFDSDEYKQLKGRALGIYPPTKRSIDELQAADKKFNPMVGM